MKPERKVYGINACQAVFEHRPVDIVRAWIGEPFTKRFGPLMSSLARAKRVYHVIDTEEEMERVSATRHHEGICLLVKSRPAVYVDEYIGKQRGSAQDCALVLEDIGNPHNLGAIVRVAAHFGVKGLLASDPSALQSGAAMRTAEGGFEAITPLFKRSLEDGLLDFRDAGYALVATSSREGQNLYGKALPRRSVLMMGSERDGLSPELNHLATHHVRIPGSGAVESLNVACATAAILGERWRTR